MKEKHELVRGGYSYRRESKRGGAGGNNYHEKAGADRQMGICRKVENQGFKNEELRTAKGKRKLREL